MAMPDAALALVQLARAPREDLTRTVYNVTSFSTSAVEIREIVRQTFTDAQIRFQPDTKREAIVDSWPADLDDSAARRDWGWQPQYDKESAFRDYLIPNITRRYQAP